MWIFPPPQYGPVWLPRETQAEGRDLAPAPAPGSQSPAPAEEGAGEGQESTKFPWQLRGAISSLSTGFGRCPLAANSMATRSGSSLGKWDTRFHDDERVGRAKLEESHLPRHWAGPPPPHPHLRVRRGGAAQYSKAREPGVVQSELGGPPVQSQSKLVPSP